MANIIIRKSSLIGAMQAKLHACHFENVSCVICNGCQLNYMYMKNAWGLQVLQVLCGIL